ncbi:DUF2892 domain-containing protein [Rhodoferax sp. PAMC 29310]|uniref:YgaP family membrane protein n=1 Tax=Rhodoferax sp. PAMC 29310 TaxID=2822760 RepID=UPI001B33AD48|nr:DUF2892 domain-containing protein [Rhodoferax sp. PAMC 29310]
MKNMNTLDRIIRLILGVALLELAYFWLAGGWQVASYVGGAIMVGTAAISFCPLYRLLGLSTVSRHPKTSGTAVSVVAGVLLVTMVVGGSYASAFFSRKLFLEDFNAMNNYYKQTLFLTGKNERGKAVVNLNKLLPAYQQFQDKYTRYQPYALRGDPQLTSDLAQVATLFKEVAPLVHTGDLHQAHLDLEKVRPVFQEMFKRNGFSMLAVALVDFHDAMETVLDAANQKDPTKLIGLYPAVSGKLKVVEAELNDAEIQDIRTNLDELLSLSKAPHSEALPAKGDALKSSFVKVYLKRG